MSVKLETTTNQVQFEDNYLTRNHRSITSTPDIALTEYVANAWDAGAYNVKIKIPDEDSSELISIEDDGTGMTDAEFNQRWMTLNYDRQKRQGKKVTFPKNTESYSRIAYGRNGVGRHGMLCFNDSYTIETWCNGKCNRYTIGTSSGNQPFEVIDHVSSDKSGHGTIISAYINKHHPDPNEMIDIISARFLYDPKFIVDVNGKTIDLMDQKNICQTKEVKINNINLKMTMIDSTKSALNAHQHGIAFWISGRLVGQPSWTINNYQFLDGRYRAAKRYTIIIETDDLIEEILPDWTGFANTANMKMFLQEFKPHIEDFLNSVMIGQIEDLQQDIIEETRPQLETLNPSGQRDVSKFIELLSTKNPTINHDFFKIAVEAMVSIEKAKNGEQLLLKISQMSADDIDKLADLLNSWDVDDILAVLNEIDKRITIIEAIDRICEDKNTDELHTLHPLVLNSRWLFGAEFDSPMFVSNKTLATVVNKLFDKSKIDLAEIDNPKRRPDIVVLNDSSFKAVCTDRIDGKSGGVMKPDQILIIELKRGGFKINSKEV